MYIHIYIYIMISTRSHFSSSAQKAQIMARTESAVLHEFTQTLDGGRLGQLLSLGRFRYIDAARLISRLLDVEAKQNERRLRVEIKNRLKEYPGKVWDNDFSLELLPLLIAEYISIEVLN